MEKYKEAHREGISAKAETHDTGSLARLPMPGGALSAPVPSLEQSLLHRALPPKERHEQVRLPSGQACKPQMPRSSPSVLDAVMHA